MTTTAAQNAAICNRASELIRERGWFRMASATHKELRERKTENPVCLLFAVTFAKRALVPDAAISLDYEMKLLGLDIETSKWNDAHTKRDVLNLLTERAAYWENPTVFV